MILAIDPGKSGGLATWDGKRARCWPMPPTDADLANAIREFREEHEELVAYVEGLVKHAGKNAPASAIAVYAHNHGVAIGALTALRIRVVTVRPQEWIKALSLGTKPRGGSQSAWKNKLKGKAQEFYPECKVTLKTSDALLLLEHARRQMVRPGEIDEQMKRDLRSTTPVLF